MGWVTLMFLSSLCVASLGMDAALRELMRDYEKDELPNKGSPTQVKIGGYINALKLNLQEATMTVDMYMKMSWIEPRLTGTPGCRIMYAEYLWKPDIFFKDAWDVKKFNVPEPNYVMKLSPDGTIYYASKIVAELRCRQMAKFHSAFQCPISFDSFGYMMNEMYLSWMDSSVQIDSNVILSGYTMEDTILYDCSQNYTIGTFPCLEARILFRTD